MAPPSLRIARVLLFLAGGLVTATMVLIVAASQERLGATPWLALLALDAAGFFAARKALPRDGRRGKTLAVGAAVGMGALGIVTGFGAGMLSSPAASVGALAAWAALLHPPTRRMALAGTGSDRARRDRSDRVAKVRSRAARSAAARARRDTPATATA